MATVWVLRFMSFSYALVLSTLSLLLLLGSSTGYLYIVLLTVLLYLTFRTQKTIVGLFGLTLLCVALVTLLFVVQALVIPVILDGNKLGLGLGYTARVFFVILTVLLLLICIVVGSSLFREF